MAEVVLKNVKKSYDGKTFAVKGVDLTVKDKEFMVLVGPSGCGKSTLLRMIAGLEDITSGELYIDGELKNDVPPKDRDIAMVFQNYALYPHMTVYENMAFGLKLRKFSRDEIDRRVKEAAEILGLEELLERRPKELSGGQRQRVAVGRAIVRKPKVFLFDEPLSNLDAKLRVQMRLEISRLHKKLNTTMIYVTHDQTEAMTMGDRICVLKDGELQQVDTPMNLYKNPVNQFVAGFIGSPAMNFFKGVLQSREDGKTVFVSGRIKIFLSGKTAESLSDYFGKEIVMGIRPEDFYPVSSEGGEFTIKCKIDVEEPLGSETLYYFSDEGRNFCIRRPDTGEKINAGQEVVFGIREEGVRFFTVENGKKL